MEKIFALVEKYCFQDTLISLASLRNLSNSFSPEEIGFRYKLDHQKVMVNVGPWDSLATMIRDRLMSLSMEMKFSFIEFPMIWKRRSKRSMQFRNWITSSVIDCEKGDRLRTFISSLKKA